jgi:hypothetical protein
MARGSNVYVVVDRTTKDLVAGFSVKYEMFDWLERQGRTEDDTILWRLRDGRGYTKDKSPIEMKWD